MVTVVRLPVPVSTRAPTGETAAYLVGREDAVLVDPPARDETLDAAVEAVDVGHVVVTHTHADHVGGVLLYAERTGATVWCRRGRESRFTRSTGIEPDRTFVEGTTIGPTSVVDTPGHAPDHVAFSVRAGPDGERVALLTGDLVVAEGSVVVGAPEGDMRAYLTSLRRLYARNPVRLYPAHGPVVDDPRDTLGRLLQHRTDRERRVREAIDDGAQSIDEIVDRAYEKDLTDVEDLAKATVRAHLEKLAVESDEDVPVP